MSKEEASVNIPKDLIEPIIKAKIEAAVMEGLGASTNLIEAVVVRVLNETVDSAGKPSTYGSKPLYTWLAEDCIRAATQETIKKFFSERQKEIETELVKTLESKAGRSKMVKVILDAMLGSMTDNWRTKFTAEITHRHE
jgi:hypothetical protein